MDPEREEAFITLTRQRSVATACLLRFKCFWTTHGKIASLETINDWTNRCAWQIDRFLYIQKQIHSFLVEGSEEEENHILLTENVVTFYCELIQEARSCIDHYMFRRATRA